MVGGPLLGGLVPVLALVALIVLAVVFLLAPAFFLSLMLIIAGLVVLVVFRAHPWGLALGFVVLILGFALGVLAQGQGLSLALVHL